MFPLQIISGILENGLKPTKLKNYENSGKRSSQRFTEKLIRKFSWNHKKIDKKKINKLLEAQSINF